MGGGEVDYWPPDYPELKARSYLDPEIYDEWIGRAAVLAGVDARRYGYRSELTSRAIWRWVKWNAIREAPQHWHFLHRCRSLSAMITEFKDWTYGMKLDGLSYVASDVDSVVRFGYWLYNEGNIPGYSPLVPIIWGLAIIGAAWDGHLNSSLCRICFRRARPGEAHCDFHSQSIAVDFTASEAYQNYRRGLKARKLVLQQPHLVAHLFRKPVELYLENAQALSMALFPQRPVDAPSDLSRLIEVLELSPLVVTAADIQEFRTMSYKDIVDSLRSTIDPYNWGIDLWDVNVHRAERWFEFEMMAAPGVRGKGYKTRERVNQAIELAKAGSSKSQIAASLEVTRSTISQWIRRYPSFKAALPKQ